MLSIFLLCVCLCVCVKCYLLKKEEAKNLSKLISSYLYCTLLRTWCIIFNMRIDIRMIENFCFFLFFFGAFRKKMKWKFFSVSLSECTVRANISQFSKLKIFVIVTSVTCWHYWLFSNSVWYCYSNIMCVTFVLPTLRQKFTLKLNEQGNF